MDDDEPPSIDAFIATQLARLQVRNPPHKVPCPYCDGGVVFDGENEHVCIYCCGRSWIVSAL